jgi:heme/copper-type cytochrome/quinol oxidase subunit 4
MDRLNNISIGTTANRPAIVAAAAAAVIGAPEWVRIGASPWEGLAEFARSLLVAYVLARLLARAQARTWKSAFLFSLGVCAFQAVILLGSFLHEHMSPVAYAVRGAYAVGSTLVTVVVLGLLKALATGGHANETSPASFPATPTRTRARINGKAIFVAAVAALVVGSLWYSPLLFGVAWAHLKAGAGVSNGRVPPAEVFGEFVRSATVAYVLARFIVTMRLAARSSVLFGGAMWLGFHMTLLLFSVIHERMPVALFAIHAGHGLANDLVIAAIVGAWRGKVHAIGVAGARASTTAATTAHTLEW